MLLLFVCFDDAKIVYLFLPYKYFSYFFEKIFGSIKKSRANRWICAARCDENEKAGGEEMGGAPPASVERMVWL